MFNLVLFFVVFFLLRMTIFTSSVQKYFLQYMGQVFLAQSLFFLFFTLLTLNYLLNMYQSSGLFDFGGFSVLACTLEQRFISLNALSLNLIDVYLYPFIYVFSLITVLSIVFCLSYNKDESFSFMFYCQVILFAGYLLFFYQLINNLFFRLRNALSTEFFYTL